MAKPSFAQERLKMVRRGLCRTPEQWEGLIDEWEESNLPKVVFCKEKNIDVSSLRRWIRELRPSLMHKNFREAVNKWEAIIEDWKKSGLSRNAYCLQNKLSQSLYKWEKKLSSPALRETISAAAVKRWTKIIKDWEKSGCLGSVYCKKREITATTLYHWRRRLNPTKYPQCKKEQPAPYELSLQDLLMPAALSRPFSKEGFSPSQRVEITLSQGHSLTLEGGFNREKLISFLTPLFKRDL